MKSNMLFAAVVFQAVIAVGAWAPHAGSGDTHLQIQNQSVSRNRPAIAEECVYFDPATLHIGYFLDAHSVTLVAAPLRRISTFESKDEAARAMNIMRQFGINELCRTANSKLSYMLASGSAPKGELRCENYVSFDPRLLKAERPGSDWRVVSGKTVLFNFGPDEQAARQALKAIRYYGFNARCSTGENGFAFLYAVQQPREITQKAYREAKAVSAR